METTKIAVIGLGYVGLPLAVEFGKQRETVGFDNYQNRVDALRRIHNPQVIYARNSMGQ